MSGRIQQRISRDFGLRPVADWDEKIRSALEDLSNRLRSPVDRVAEMVERQTSLLREVAGTLTVGESYFFRQPDDFKQVLDFVEMERKRSSGPISLKFLSAGCSRGEESYSLAIELFERFGQFAVDSCEIVGCDIDAGAINVANQGRYSDWSLRSTPPDVLKKHFRPVDDHWWQLWQGPLGPVKFVHLGIRELVSHVTPGSFDVVMFRNVSIYLDQPARDDLYSRFAAAIRPGGLLIVAATDPSPPSALFRRTERSSSATFYRRVESELEDGRQAPLSESESGLKRGALQPQGACPGDCGTAEPWSDADGGSVEAILARGVDLVTRDPMSPRGYLLKGQALIAAARFDEAVSDLRRALFVDPQHRLGRFWYCQALRLAGREDQALKQSRALARALAVIHPKSPLEDGQTSCEELTKAVFDFEGGAV